MPAVRSAVLSACIYAALLTACGKDRVAGGYDDVENPAIQVSLVDTAGKPFGAAEVRVYARWQNPFKDSIPTLMRAVGDTGIKLRDTSIAAALEAAKARGTPSPGKDTLEFNLMATAAGGEAYLGGYSLIKGAYGWRFQRRAEGSTTYQGANGLLPAVPVMTAPILAQAGNIGARGLELGLKRVFVAGSPYRSEIAVDGSFRLDRIAKGKYGLMAIAADDKVYSALDSLTTGAAYAGSEWSEAEIIWVQKP